VPWPAATLALVTRLALSLLFTVWVAPIPLVIELALVLSYPSAGTVTVVVTLSTPSPPTSMVSVVLPAVFCG
jgi:hypothetical protein